MKKEKNLTRALLGTLLCVALTACSYNPFISNNHDTGSVEGRVVGTVAGAGTMTALGAPNPVRIIAGLTGGSVGYYVTTLRYDAGGVMQSGGEVYQIGDYVGIMIPTDKLFEPNTSDFLPQANPILDSAVAVLARSPNNNVVISGNTSGFYRAKWEQKLSETRAKVVAAYLWNAGINQFREQNINLRKLNYVGYGNYFPIASNDRNDGIRMNSRLQITSYPSNKDLHLDPRHITMNNVGSLSDPAHNELPREACDQTNNNPGCE